MDQTRVAKKSYYDMCTYFHFPEQILSVNKLQKVCVFDICANYHSKTPLQAHSHVMSPFAIFFDLCCPVLENVNVTLVATELIFDVFT